MTHIYSDGMAFLGPSPLARAILRKMCALFVYGFPSAASLARGALLAQCSQHACVCGQMELSWCHWLAAFARRLQRNLTTVPEKPLEHPSHAAYTNGTAAEESERLIKRYRKKSHKGHSDVWDSLSDGIGLIAIQIC